MTDLRCCRSWLTISRGGSIWLIVWLTLLTPATNAADNVSANLIQFNNDGFWSWYMDERVIHDPSNGQFLMSSISSSNFTELRNNGGTVRVTSFDPASGASRSVFMADIDEDDHNAGGLLVLPSGKYLHMYSNHGSPYTPQTTPYRVTRWRVSNNPHDITSWTTETTFNWSTTPGWNQNPFANSGVSYHNLYYLSAEDRVYNFSRGTHMGMNTLLYDYNTNSVTWAGQFQQTHVGPTGYYGQGYFKFASNGTDRIYFIGGETHPYEINANMYAGYISDGKTYKMDGTLMDANMFDNMQSAPRRYRPVHRRLYARSAGRPIGNWLQQTVDRGLSPKLRRHTDRAVHLEVQ